MNISASLEAEEINLKITPLVAELSKLLLEVDMEEFDRVQQSLVEDIKEHQERAALTVAFVGQYNAGKSTTISGKTSINAGGEKYGHDKHQSLVLAKIVT
jgi:ribosome biogenesis GTPase A